MGFSIHLIMDSEKHNTCTALIQMVDTWVEAFDEGELSAVLMLDVSAAFNLVNLELLVRKLETYGFDPDSLTWISSYLYLRIQQVYIDGASSDCKLG